MAGSVLDNNPGLIDTLSRGLKSTFAEALTQGVDDSYREIAMTVPSGSGKEIYKFLTDMPGMKLWFGNRITDGYAVEALEIENRPYEATIEIDEFDLDDDKLGLYTLAAAQLGNVAARMPAEIVSGMLESGFTVNGYDGTTFFSDSHAFGDNKGTTALDANAFAAGVLAMRGFKSTNGQVLGMNRSLILVVPPALEATAISIIGNQFLTDGTNNPNFGKARIVVLTSLTDANNWYLIGQNGVLRPLIFQERMAPRTRRDDNRLFDKHKIFWGVDARWGVGFGLPHMAFGALVT
jgi:phage major head subunit gpT-like protein